MTSRAEVQELVFKQPVTINGALAAKYALPHFITLFEVRDSTGFDSTRSADAISVGLYNSRGREITGFEIKTARSDWLRELKQPEKAEEIGKFCDWFFLVTSDESIAKIDEIPTPWGWMVLKGERLKVLKKPEKMKPFPLDRPMLCSLLYSLKEKCYADINQQITEQVANRLKSEHSGLQYTAESWTRRYEALEQSVSEFETASGINFSSGWADRPKIGAAVRRVMAEGTKIEEYKRELNFIAKRARTLAETVERELAEVNSDQQ